MRFVLSLFAVIAVLPAVLACSFCSQGFTKSQTLREQCADAKIVLAGVLKNPIAKADGSGTTEFHLTHAVKGTLGKTTSLLIPKYLPVIADTPPDYVLFCSVNEGKLEIVQGQSGGKTLVEYLKKLADLDGQPTAKRLGFFFQHLDSADASISTDAFLEFAKANDTELAQAKPYLNAAKIREWLTNPKTGEERLGVYGLMLGLCGGKSDADWLTSELSATQISERTRNNLGGLLTGLTLLDENRGWKLTERLLQNPMAHFSEKLSILSTLRYFQATRGKESRSKLLTGYRQLIRDADIADLAIDDLRRWKWWDETESILEQFPKPTHAAPAIRRSIVRYALQCPDEKATVFVRQLRATDAELVKKVEASLKLLEAK